MKALLAKGATADEAATRYGDILEDQAHTFNHVPLGACVIGVLPRWHLPGGVGLGYELERHRIIEIPQLGGLHRRYERVAA